MKLHDAADAPNPRRVRVFQCCQNTHPTPAYGEVCREHGIGFLELLDRRLDDDAFIAEGAISMADISALVAIDFGRVVKVRIAEQRAALRRWHEKMTARPSAGT